MGRNDWITWNRVKNCWRSWVLEKVGTLSRFWPFLFAKSYEGPYSVICRILSLSSLLLRYRDFRRSLQQVQDGTTIGDARKAAEALVSVSWYNNVAISMQQCVLLPIHILMSCIIEFSILIIQAFLCIRLLSYNLIEDTWFLFLQLMKNPSTPQQFWLHLLYDSVSNSYSTRTSFTS